MSEPSGVSLRRRRSRVEANRLVMEFEQSGLTRQAFCVDRGLSVAALDKYRRRCSLELKPAQQHPAENRILPVEFLGGIVPTHTLAVGGCRTLWVELFNGRRIGVADGFDTATLVRLVAVLEGPAGSGQLPGAGSLQKA